MKMMLLEEINFIKTFISKGLLKYTFYSQCYENQEEDAKIADPARASGGKNSRELCCKEALASYPS